MGPSIRNEAQTKQTEGIVERNKHGSMHTGLLFDLRVHQTVVTSKTEKSLTMY